MKIWPLWFVIIGLLMFFVGYALACFTLGCAHVGMIISAIGVIFILIGIGLTIQLNLKAEPAKPKTS